MQTTNYWKQFADTGRVEDYLFYADCERLRTEKEPEQAGEQPYAGIHMCDRNNIETGAYWRI